MKTKEKIFITDNPLLEIDTKRRVMLAFEQCKQAAKLVTDFGFTLTREIVADCLTLRKVIKSRSAQGTAKWVGESTDKYQKELEAVEVFEGDEHMKTEFSKMMDKVGASDERPAAKEAKNNALKKEYESMLSRIWGLFHTGRQPIDTEPLLRYYDVEAGEVILPKDIGERIKADTATYAETEKGIKAYKLHRQIAENLNTLAGMMKNASRSNFTSNVDALFFEGEDGSVQPSPIDYDIYTN